MWGVNGNLGAVDQPVQARRSSPPTWRDPRLWIGVVIVAASVMVGARLLDAADTSVTVWAADHDLAEGDTVSAADLVSVRVRFVDEADLARYLPTWRELPADLTLLRDVDAGELLPRGALGAPADSEVMRVPVAVPDHQLPSEIAVGSRVDVWLSADGERRARLVLTDVEVVDVPAASDEFGTADTRMLVLGVPEAEQDAVSRTLAGVGTGSLTIVGRG